MAPLTLFPVKLSQSGFLILLGVTLLGQETHAGGFEKATPWSGQYAALGGAAVGAAAGADSLFFNPAGLARSSRGNSTFELSINLSPTLSQFTGPFATTDAETSSVGFSPV